MRVSFFAAWVGITSWVLTEDKGIVRRIEKAFFGSRLWSSFYYLAVARLFEHIGTLTVESAAEEMAAEC
jgi:hypothetical protein